MDTLAVRLTVPPAGPVEDFHLQVSAPCRAHVKKTGRQIAGRFLFSYSRLKPLPQDLLALWEIYSRLKPLPQDLLALWEIYSRLKPLPQDLLALCEIY